MAVFIFYVSLYVLLLSPIVDVRFLQERIYRKRPYNLTITHNR